MKTSPNEPSLDVLGRLGAAVRAWDRFWFKPTDPTTLCFMRICAGLVLLYIHISYSFDLMSYLSPTRAWTDESVIHYVQYDRPFYGLSNEWNGKGEEHKGQFYWSVFFHLHDDHWIWLAHLAIVGCTLLFTLGLWTRLMAVLTWVGALSYIERATNMMFGMDTMAAIALFYLMIGPSGATLSLDRWFAVRRARRLDPGAIVPVEPSIMANIAIRLFQIHFCFIYGASGVSKLQGAAWWNGTALWSCVANYSFAPMEMPPFRWFLRFLCDHRFLWELFMSGSALFTLVMEIGFPFLVWTRRFRWLMVCGAMLLHLGIGTMMGLVGFSMLMIVLVTSFIPPEVVRRQLDRFFRRKMAAQSPVPPPSAPVGNRPEAFAVAGGS